MNMKITNQLLSIVNHIKFLIYEHKGFSYYKLSKYIIFNNVGDIFEKIHKDYNVPKLENSRWRRMPSLCTIDVIDIL